MASPVISLAAWRVARVWGEASREPIDEIVQEVFVKLCEDRRRILREFEDRGHDSFLKLLRVITASVATDHFRRARAEKRGGGATTVALEVPGIEEQIPDEQSTEAVEWSTLIMQIDGLLLRFPESITERDRTLFWLYYRQGLTAQAIAAIPAIGLGAKGVESALLRMVKLLREAIRTRERDRAGTGTIGVASNEAMSHSETVTSPGPVVVPLRPGSTGSNANAQAQTPEQAEKGFSPVVAINSVKRK